ncbi:hypothetical protein ACLOJK_009039 [Asimina triloba]
MLNWRTSRFDVVVTMMDSIWEFRLLSRFTISEVLPEFAVIEGDPYCDRTSLLVLICCGCLDALLLLATGGMRLPLGVLGRSVGHRSKREEAGAMAVQI